MDSITIQSAELEVELIPTIGGRINQIRSLRCISSPDLLIDEAHWQRRAALASNSGARRLSGIDTLRWGCYPMAPWPGRIAGGRFSFEGESFALPLNLGKSAIHGTAFAGPWKVINRSDSKAEFEFPLGEPWPWKGVLHQLVEVHDNVIALTLEVHAGRAQRFPAGAGWHPWFSRRGMDPEVRVNASDYFGTDDALIPTGRLLPANGELDLSGGPPLGDRRLDHVYAAPAWPITVDWDDVRLELSASPNASCVCIYTPPEGFCVEPMTCAADAFNIKGGTKNLGAAIVDANSPLIVRSWLRFWPK